MKRRGDARQNDHVFERLDRESVHEVIADECDDDVADDGDDEGRHRRSDVLHATSGKSEPKPGFAEKNRRVPHHADNHRRDGARCDG